MASAQNIGKSAASGLDDIQTRGCRYTSTSWDSNTGRKKLPPLQAIQQRGIVTPVINSSSCGRSDTVQLTMKNLSAADASRKRLIAGSFKQEIVRSECASKMSTRPAQPPSASFFKPPPASLVSGMKFTGRPKEAFPMEKILSKDHSWVPGPFDLKAEAGMRKTATQSLWAAGNFPAVANGIAQFHAKAYNG